MKRKGFTLAEILGVIVILSLLMVIIVPTVINRITGTRDDAASAGEEIVFKAADEYISDHPGDFPNGKAARYCITINELMADGKLVPTGNKNGKDVYIDSISGEDYTNLSVMVTIYSSGIRDYEIKEGDTCAELAALPIIDFLVKPNTSAWVKQRVVTILYPKLEGYSYQYRIDNGKWTDAGSLNDYNDDYYSLELPAFTKISTLYARAKGNNVINGRVQLGNIDSEKPVVRKISVPSGWSNKNKTATATVYDGISGVKSYYLSTSSSKPSESSSGWVDVNYSKGEKTIKLNDLDNGTYYLWVKDKAGNISDTTDKSKFVVDKIDKVKPTCSISASGTEGDNNWFKSNIKLKLEYNDTGGSDVDKYGIVNSSTVNYNSKKTVTHSVNTKGITYYGYVKDKAGNTNKCSLTIKKDSTKPTCSIKVSGTKGNNDWYRSTVDMTLKYSDEGGSGVATYDISNSSSASYNKRSSVSHIGDTKKVTYYGYVKDNAGNVSKCNTTFKKDSTNPTCSITQSTSSSVISLTLNISGNDAMSGLAEKPYSWINRNSFGTTKTYTVKKNGTYNGYVKDKAGNIGSCNKSVNNIITKPNKPTIVNPTNGNWVNYDFSLTVSTTSKADILGYWYYSYDAKNWTRYDKSSYNSYGKQSFVTSPYSAERNQATYIRVCNKEASGANDTENCSDYASTMIRIDKTKPVFNYTLRKMYYDQDVGQAFSGQWSRNEIRRDFKPTDNASGIDRTEYNSGGGWQLETNLTNWRMGEGINEADFRTIDKAGNISNTVHIKLMVDWTPPSFDSKIHRRDCNYVSLGYDTGSWFGYRISDNVSGVNYNSSSYAEYCYTGHTASRCGATCSSGNQFSHRPSKIFGSSDNRFYQEAKFHAFTTAVNGNAVSTSCVLGYSVIVNYKAVDIAGNVATKQVVYDFPRDGNGNCYNFG